MSGYLQQLGAALNQPSMQQLMQGSPGQTATFDPGAAMGMPGTANPQSMSVSGAQGMSPEQALYTMMGNNLQAQNTLAPISALGQVGQEYLNKNVETRHQMPLAPEFGMAHSVMGPLQFGSSQNPLLTYLSMMGAR